MSAALCDVAPGAIFATGMSSGGGMTSYLACALSGQVAAVAPIAANNYVLTKLGCHSGHRVALLEVHGTADSVVPYQGVSATIDPPWPLPLIPRLDDDLGAPRRLPEEPDLAPGGSSSDSLHLPELCSRGRRLALPARRCGPRSPEGTRGSAGGQRHLPILLSAPTPIADLRTAAANARCPSPAPVAVVARSGTRVDSGRRTTGADIDTAGDGLSTVYVFRRSYSRASGVPVHTKEAPRCVVP